MKPISISELRQLVGGRPLTTLPEGNPDELFVRAVCTDTRRLDPNCLFVALKGESHDAHQFVGTLRGPLGGGPAAGGPAAGGPVAGGFVLAALVEREPETLPQGVYVLLVPSTRVAMGKIAAHVRTQMVGSVIAVGGSNGKTSTKHLIDAALRSRLRGTISPKSFNNDIGVPLTIFNHDPNFDYLVLEVGTNHHGELKVLSDMASPDIAVITSISHEHLEGLSDLAGVRREEASIISGLKSDGLLVVNGDDPDLLPYLGPFKGRRVTFGFGEHNDLFATHVKVTAEGTSFRVNNSRSEVFVPVLGRHTASNALAAIAIARWLVLPEQEVIAALAHATGPEMRQQLQSIKGVTVLNDAYNANPASVRSALDTFMALPASNTGRRVAVLGDMRELGDASDELHRELGKLIASLGLEMLVFVGRQAKLTLEAAQAHGLPAHAATWFGDSAAAANYVKDAVSPGDLVLLKGSRGVKLEVIAQQLAGPDASGTSLRIA